MSGKPTVLLSACGAIALMLACGVPPPDRAGDHTHPQAVASSAVTEIDRAVSEPGGEHIGTALSVRIYLHPLPATMPGAASDTPEQVALGRRLFFEKAVSLTKTQSCNDCHLLGDGRAGVDNQPVSKGAKGVSGDRNSPTVLNAGFHLAQFWDGRAADLEEQAKGPVTNPKEMAMTTEAAVVERLNGTPGYTDAFAGAFPGQAQPITFDNVARAIAAFERTLVAPGRFDRFMRGDTAALTTEEKLGLMRFVSTGCIECHTGASLGGRIYEKFGVFSPYANEKDLGRYNVTQRDEDRYVFKVPSLRNATLTGPYFHDGQVSSIREAVRLMAHMQLDKTLAPDEVGEIVRFLRTLEMEKPIITGGD